MYQNSDKRISPKYMEEYSGKNNVQLY